jgi:DNA-binding beta-propeller fold protein YncE
VKASFVGSTQGIGNSRGLFGRAFATRGVLRGVDGGGAPALWLLLMLALAAALLLFAAPASAARNHVFAHAFGESGSGPGQLTEPGGVAINEASGVVYVVDKGNNRVERFDGETGAFLGQFDGTATPAGAFENLEGIAIDNAAGSPSFGDVYVADTGHRVIDKFDAEGVYLSQITGTCPAPGTCLPGEIIPFGEILPGAAVDSSGAVFVYQGADTETTEIDKFSNALDNEPVETNAVSLATGAVSPGVVVDSADDLFVNTFFHGVVKLSASGAALAEKIGGGERAAGLAIDRADDDLYFGASTEIDVLGATFTTEESFGPPHLTASAGITIEASTGSVYVTDSAADRVSVFALEPVAPPLIASESAAGISTTSATLEAEINPRSLPGEAPTTYRFEYDTAPYAEGGPPHGASAPSSPARIPAAFGVSGVSAGIEGVTPSTTYHFRVVAQNALGTSVGPDRTFTTQSAFTSTLLPDGRGWELVSPPDKHGSPIPGLTAEGGAIQAAADGSGIAYVAIGSTTGEAAEGNRSLFPSQLLSERQGPADWATRDLSTQIAEPSGVTAALRTEFKLFSADLSLAAVRPNGPTPLAPSAAPNRLTLYLRSNFAAAGFCGASCYTPLVTGCPELPESCPPAVESAANIVPGSQFGTSNFFQPEFSNATPDFTHVVFGSKTAILPGFEPGEGGGLYEWSASGLTPISVDLSGNPLSPTQTTFGYGALGGGLYDLNRGQRHAFSDDGSRVAFTATNGNLYLRVNSTSPQSVSGACDEAGRACTIQLNAPEPGCTTCESGVASFQAGSADGSRYFFLDEKRLTSDSTVGGPSDPFTNGRDLYMCEVAETQAGHLACDLSDLSVDSNFGVSGESANILGREVSAVDEAGRNIYFVANGRLSPDAVHGDCTTNTKPTVGKSQRCNLYHLDATSGEIKLVTVVAGTDSELITLNGNSANGSPSRLLARSSPNGQYFTFVSELPLTGYDNRDAKTGARDEEVFLYDAKADGGQGNLLCVSCNPSGARPAGIRGGGEPPLEFDPVGNYGGRSVAATTPGWEVNGPGEELYEPRYLGDSGRMFFDSADSLVPQDTNGTVDVYEFEYPQGPGQPPSNDCTAASPEFSSISGGCTSLISSGISPEESVFLDASESGDDVFFVTQSRLGAKDVDSATDVYDARVGGGEPQLVKPVECSGDACQPPSTPPVDATPGSLTFNGAGNVTQCPKGKELKKDKCVKQRAKKRQHHKKRQHQKKGQKRTAKPDGGGPK